MQLKSKIKTISMQEILNILKSTDGNITQTLIHFGINPTNSTAKNYLLNIIKEHTSITRGLKRRGYTVNDVRLAVEHSICFSDVCRALKLTTHGSNIKSIKKMLLKHTIDISHFDLKLAATLGRKKFTRESLLIVNSNAARSTAKRFILKNELMEYKCICCGNPGTHNGKFLSLHLEHMNGINNDHRLENLCFLCPNCHSQTETFGSKNTPVVRRMAEHRSVA